jgi:hypothetical protein
MKRDGRSFDHRTLEAIRLMAVERVREGELPSSVVASYGFSRTAIYKWIKAASTPGIGLEALRSRSRRPIVVDRDLRRSSDTTSGPASSRLIGRAISAILPPSTRRMVLVDICGAGH